MNVFLKAIILVWLSASVAVHTQAQDTLRSPKTARSLSKLKEAKEPKVDSSRLLTYTLQDIDSRDSFVRKGLDKYFQQYDPARQQDFDFAHLGNMGSAAYPLALDLRRDASFSLGYKQYGLYQKSVNDILHFDQVRPFSELYFSGGQTQSDLRVKALFSRSFANNVNLVIDYDRISQQGDYSNQAVKQTNLLTSLSYRSKKRLSIFFSYIINSSIEESNGGVENTETLDSNIYQIRSAVPVFSSDGISRLQNQQLVLNAFYSLGQDSIASDFVNTIQYQAQTFNEFFRFTDASTSLDSILYKNYWVSDRGIRNYNEHSRVRNGIYLNSKFRDYYHFKAGAVYDFNSYDISSNQDNFSEIYLVFNGGIQLKNRLKIDAKFYYGLLDVANEFALDAKANLRLTKNQGFNFSFLTSRYGVDLIKERAAINQSAFYDGDMNAVILQTLGAEYYNKNYGFRAGGKLQNTFNFVYFDTASLPKQEAGLYSVSLIYGGLDLKYKSMVFENFLFLQNQSRQLLNLPTVFTKNSVSYQGLIFKQKMLLKVGLDFRYVVNDLLPRYNPVIGQFYRNDTVTNVPYPLVDGHISFKVSTFTTFFKYENLTSFISENVDQMVVGYPQFDARFRFGILWNLWN